MVSEASLPRILIVEDHAFTIKGLRQFLELEGFEPIEAPDTTSAYAALARNKFAAAVIDIELPEVTGKQIQRDAGFHLTRGIKEMHPLVGVVLLSSHPDRGRQFWDLVSQGHRGLGYLLKSGDPQLLVRAIQHVIDKQIYCDPQVTHTSHLVLELEKRLKEDEKAYIEFAIREFPNLTPREFEVASALADSHDIKGVARLLGISENVVGNYITRIFEKLQLNTAPNQLSPRTLLIKAMIIYGIQNDH